MDIKHHTQPELLESYSFWWSQARLVIAAIALFLGAVPPLYYVLHNYYLDRLLLTIAWLISGVASAYLLYRWNKSGQKVFGGKINKDVWAFFVSVVSGLNLGLAGLLKINIGLSITSNRIILLVVGIAYLLAAVYLQQRWQAHGNKMF